VGAFLASFFIGFLYTFGQVLFPQAAYVILFVPMVAALALRPQGLFGPRAA
jgi:branched-chain amino acid transport system permease protein